MESTSQESQGGTAMESTPQESQSGTGRKRMIYSVVGLILVVIAVTGFYFGYWKKTPEYSMGIILDAVKQHDVVAFQRHVDLDSLLLRAFDDIITTSLTKEEDGDVKTMAAGFAQTFKQPAINVMKDGIKRYVETGSFELSGQSTSNQSSASADKSDKISAKEMREKVGLANIDFKGFMYTKKDGKTAIVGVKIWEKQVAQEFVVDVKMRELDDGTWQIAEIVNLSAYITKLNEAKVQKLAELNRPIEEQINKALIIGKVSPRKVPKDRGGFLTMLEVTIPMIVNDNRPVVEIEGTMTTVNQDKPLFKGTFSAKGAIYKVLKYNWDLNPFISGQKTILGTPDNSLTTVIKVRRIKFSDGSELRMLDELPKL